MEERQEAVTRLGIEDKMPSKWDLHELSTPLNTMVKQEVPIMYGLNSNKLRASIIEDVSTKFNMLLSPVNTFTYYISFL